MVSARFLWSRLQRRGAAPRQLQKNILKWPLLLLTAAVCPLAKSESVNHVYSTSPPSYERTSTANVEASPSKWNQFLSENLEPDLSRWRARAPLHAADVLELWPQQHRQQLTAVLRLVLVYGNRLYWPDREDVNGTGPPRPCSPHKEAFHATLSPLLESNQLQLPNVLFMFNTDDNRPRFCAPMRQCRAPLISLIKTVGMPDGAGGGGEEDEGGGEDEDILIPQMLWMPDTLHSVPWREKEDVAFFRGVPYCSGLWYGKFHCAHMCPRPYLAWRSLEDQQAGRPRTLDVGIVQPYYGTMSYVGISPGQRRPCVPSDLPVVAPVPIPDHSRYKWLLQLEGITASYRLIQLMSINSVVLIQRSPWVEYFYRSLRPGVHYVPFWNTTARGADDVYDVVSELRTRDAADPASIQSMAHAAQGFTARFGTPAARVRYLRDALIGYKALFADMDTFLEGYVGGLRNRGFPIP